MAFCFSKSVPFKSPNKKKAQRNGWDAASLDVDQMLRHQIWKLLHSFSFHGQEMLVTPVVPLR